MNKNSTQIFLLCYANPQRMPIKTCVVTNELKYNKYRHKNKNFFLNPRKWIQHRNRFFLIIFQFLLSLFSCKLAIFNKYYREEVQTMYDNRDIILQNIFQLFNFMSVFVFTIFSNLECDGDPDIHIMYCSLFKFLSDNLPSFFSNWLQKFLV